MNYNEQTTAEAVAEFLTFTLGGETYGIDILKVQEIRGYDAVTRIANAPEFLKGVTNLRGVIVPIVDMRIKFGLGRITYDEFTVVIIMNVAGRVVGMVVDTVADVVALSDKDVRPAPDLASTVETRYIDGLATLNGQMIILVDIERLLTSPEMQLVADAAA